ncbi:MAG: hypothetical protein LLG16_03855 [Euryarchaeota archaeon]|nr:hypothetical protein [Euryarchaeota archaeon]
MDGKRSLEEVKKEFEGKSYTREAERMINKEGYGLTVRFGTGKISKVYVPVKPSGNSRQ